VSGVQIHDPPTALFCLPHAGGTAAVVSAWIGRAVPELDVVGLEYPGHGRRMSEPFAESVAELTEDLMPAVEEAQGSIGFFGHSLGAVVAFELALALRAEGDTRVAGLVVSGCSAPGQWTSDAGGEVSDDVLLTLVSAGGAGAELFDEEELRELFLPVLRADTEIARRYGGSLDRRADFPVLALCGDRDPIASARAMEGWRSLANDFAGVHAIEGDHFFLREHCEEVGAMIGPFFSRSAGADVADA
jgi:surfactin synthase thioesterase subunit